MPFLCSVEICERTSVHVERGRAETPHDALTHNAPPNETQTCTISHMYRFGEEVFFLLLSALFSHSACTHTCFTVFTLSIATLRRAPQRRPPSAATPMADPNSVSTSQPGLSRTQNPVVTVCAAAVCLCMALFHCLRVRLYTYQTIHKRRAV